MNIRRRIIHVIVKYRKYEPFFVNSYYNRPEFIGKGSYGTVASFFDTRNKKYVVVKKCHNIFGNEDNQNIISLERMYKEIEILLFLQGIENGCIPKTIDIYAHKNSVYIISEKVGISLFEYFRQRRYVGMNELLRKKILWKIAKCLYFFWTLGIVHRDIKTSNILIDTEQNQNDPIVMVCDFGLATNVGSEMSEGNVVTLWYRPIELLFDYCSDSHRSIDIWSYGCIIYELFKIKNSISSRVLFYSTERKDIYVAAKDIVRKIFNVIGRPTKGELVGNQSLVQKVYRYSHKFNTEGALGKMIFDQEAVNLIKNCLKYNPNNRIGADDVLKHKYFDKVKEPVNFSGNIFPFVSEFRNVWDCKKRIFEISKLIGNKFY